VPESEIERYARAREFPLIPCTLCGSQANMQRVEIKNMLREWERQYPGRTESIFSSLRNLVPSHLADPAAFDFTQRRELPPTGDGMPPVMNNLGELFE
jgi:tRNA 2-thiocytidine biosynthesis protein TtcA